MNLWGRFTRWLLVAFAVFAIPIACNRADQSTLTLSTTEETGISAVEGPSLVARLGVTPGDVRFGQLGGSTPPPASTTRREPALSVESGGQNGWGMFWWPFRPPGESPTAEPPVFTLTGADLYRVGCQSCHGPNGTGAPPDVNSLVGPIQGTSVELFAQRMKRESRPVDLDFLREVAEGAAGDLRERLQNGGEKMPAFAYLTDQEVDALVAALQRLVGIPEAPQSEHELTLSIARVGERVVKGTCHICHDATGPGRHALMMQGLVPSLASMANEENFGDLVAKVQDGVNPPMMGMMMAERTTMPKIPYLTRHELAAAMLYLRAYPPRQLIVAPPAH